MLPEINIIPQTDREISRFSGYNHSESAAVNEVYDMRNMSSDFLPVLSVRKPRGIYRRLGKINGIFGKDVFCYVDGTGFYYGGVLKGTVSDGEKQMVSLGSCILIFPDKMYYDVKEDVFGSLEAVFVQQAMATFSNDYYTESDLDEANLYIKISCHGIGSKFRLYDAVKIEGITENSLQGLNKTAVIYRIDTDFILVVGFDLGKKVYTQAAGLRVSRTVPDLQFVTEQDNRIWGCSSRNREIYASKLGDPFNWNAFEGISTDSYAATIGSDGEFTGIAAHLGYVLFFKEDCIHKIFGTKPSNYQLSVIKCRGVEKGSHKSVVTVNETLYYKSKNGIVSFDGGLPQQLYERFGRKAYTDAVGGRYEDKYYVSMREQAGAWHLFYYDQMRNVWIKEDEVKADYMLNFQGMLYYAENNVLKMVQGEEPEEIEWFAEFGDNEEDTVSPKEINKIKIRCQVAEGGTVEVFLKFDSVGDWERYSSFRSAVKRVCEIPVIPSRYDHFRIRISGRGEAKIYAISKTIMKGSDV